MERLWAPWRMQYITLIDKVDDGCIFCLKPGIAQDREHLVLYRSSRCFVIMNLYPYNNGHLMVVPYTHCHTLDALSTEDTADLWALVRQCSSALSAAFHPDGFNIGMNIGRVAGAGIDRHLHMHIVPRWNGDSNFMPVVGETKVISQSLLDAYDTLLPYFQQVA